ncbi:MAG: acyl-CoA synthetase, partial [Pseudomonadota bacterium]
EAVALVAAIGQPDAYAGELPCAYVQLREGVSVTADELRAFAKDNIGERAAVPVRIEIVEAMPVTTVGKIFKPDLRLLATTFALSTALKEKGLDAQVNVERHEKHGTLAKVALPSDKHAEATSVLGPFPVTVELVAA